MLLTYNLAECKVHLRLHSHLTYHLGLQKAPWWDPHHYCLRLPPPHRFYSPISLTQNTLLQNEAEFLTTAGPQETHLELTEILPIWQMSKAMPRLLGMIMIKSFFSATIKLMIHQGIWKTVFVRHHKGLMRSSCCVAFRVLACYLGSAHWLLRDSTRWCWIQTPFEGYTKPWRAYFGNFSRDWREKLRIQLNSSPWFKGRAGYFLDMHQGIWSKHWIVFDIFFHAIAWRREKVMSCGMNFNVKVRMQVSFTYIGRGIYTIKVCNIYPRCLLNEYQTNDLQMALPGSWKTSAQSLQQWRDHHLAQMICLLKWQPARSNVYWTHSLSLLHLYQ